MTAIFLTILSSILCFAYLISLFRIIHLLRNERKKSRQLEVAFHKRSQTLDELEKDWEESRVTYRTLIADYRKLYVQYGELAKKNKELSSELDAVRQVHPN